MWEIVGYGWLTSIIICTIAWCFYLVFKRALIIDVFWGLNIASISTIFLGLQRFTLYAIFACIIVWAWALRLSGYLLFTRAIYPHEDPRYEAIAVNFKLNRKVGFFIHYQFQGILATLMALPFLFIPHVPLECNTWFVGCISVSLLALLLEWVSDQQLRSFKKAKQSGVCDTGLWRYSRHPNYFFEWVVWVGFGLAALPAPHSWIGLASPALIFCIMYFVTGKMTEKHARSAKTEDFQRYKNNTPYFFPYLKKRKPS